MKNLLFDLVASQPNSVKDFHGGGKYAKRVFTELVNIPEIDTPKLFFYYNSNKFLDEQISHLLNDKKLQLFDITKISLEEIIRQNKIDCLYSALPDSSVLGLIEKDVCKIISTIHGVRLIETKPSFEALRYHHGRKKIKEVIKILLPNLFFKKYRNQYKTLLEKTDAITVSNHTKFALLSYFGEQKREMPVFYSPDVTDSVNHSINIPPYDSKNYFLFVSGDRWIKNNIRGLMAIDEIMSESKNFNKRVIITGVTNKNTILNYIKNKNRFEILSYVDDNELHWLNKNAFALVYMSLSEGFGYPPLESMKHGVPVIASPFTAITEICEGAAMYANPFSIKEIKNRILWLLNDQKKYDELSKMSLHQFAKIKQRQDRDLALLVQYILQ